MWQVLEPYHAIVYFAPEPKAATDALGLAGYWMSYFGLRAAPLGAVGPAVVFATFYNFAPARVSRAIPDAWRRAAPAQLLDARTTSIDAALRRVLGDAVSGAAVAEAADIARTAALAAQTAGRPLAAANAALDWPTAPHLVLSHAQTVLRESRGDAHVAALVTAQLDPCEALVMFAAAGRAESDRLRLSRGWTPDEWADAAARLVARGLLDESGALTEAGVALRDWVEERTDAAAAQPWRTVGAGQAARLADLVRPLAQLIFTDTAMAGNPMGLPAPA